LWYLYVFHRKQIKKKHLLVSESYWRIAIVLFIYVSYTNKICLYQLYSNNSPIKASKTIFTVLFCSMKYELYTLICFSSVSMNVSSSCKIPCLTLTDHCFSYNQEENNFSNIHCLTKIIVTNCSLPLTVVNPFTRLSQSY
jgi:hypothetical protein